MKLTLGFAALASTVFGNTLSDSFKELQIVGDFQGLRAWDLNNPDSTTNSPSAMLVRHLADGSAESLIDSTNGKIKAMCMTKDRKLYIGGDFTKLNGASYRFIARYDTEKNQIESISNGLDGPVTSLQCDNARKLVHIGGHFSGPYKTDIRSQGVVTWNHDLQSWQAFSQGGLYGAVDKLLTLSGFDVPTDIFAIGSFGATAERNNLVSSVPLIPVSPGDGAWQVVCNSNVDRFFRFTESATSLRYNFTANQVRSIRLRNPTSTGEGVRSFRIVDADTGENLKLKTFSEQGYNECDAECFLAAGETQVFSLLSGMQLQAIEVVFKSNYGSVPALSSLEVLAEGVDMLASSWSACPSPAFVVTPSNSWKKVDLGQKKQILASERSGDLVFTFDIPETNTYHIVLDSPGCQATNDCGQRGSVSFVLTNGATTLRNTSIGLQSEQSRLDSLFTGAFNKGEKMTISLTRASGNVAIHAVRLVAVSSVTDLSGVALYSTSTNNWISIKKPFSGDVSAIATLDSPNTFFFGSANSAVVQNGDKTQSLDAFGFKGAIKTALHVGAGKILMGGNFTVATSSGTLKNIALFDSKSNEWIPIGGGLDGSVERIFFSEDGNLRFYGDFKRAFRKISDVNGFPAPSIVTWRPQSNEFFPEVLFSGEITAGTAYGRTIYYSGIIQKFYPVFTNNIGKVDLGSNKVSSIFSPRNGSFWQNYLFVSNAGPKTVAVVDDDSPNIYRVVTFNLNTPEEQMTLLRKVNGSVSGLAYYKNSHWVVGSFGKIYKIGDDGSLITYDINGNVEFIDKNDELLVIAGDFDSVAGVSCKGVCFWNGKVWNSSSELNIGKVQALRIIQDNLWIYDNSSKIIKIDKDFRPTTSTASLSQKVTDFASISSDKMFLSTITEKQAAAVVMYDGSTFQEISNGQITAGRIERLKLVSVSTDQGPLLGKNVLLAAGRFSVGRWDDIGIAYYDGKKWAPVVSAGATSEKQGLVKDFLLTPAEPRTLPWWAIMLIALGCAFALSIPIFFYVKYRRTEQIYDVAVRNHFSIVSNILPLQAPLSRNSAATRISQATNTDIIDVEKALPPHSDTASLRNFGGIPILRYSSDDNLENISEHDASSYRTFHSESEGSNTITSPSTSQNGFGEKESPDKPRSFLELEHDHKTVHVVEMDDLQNAINDIAISAEELEIEEEDVVQSDESQGESKSILETNLSQNQEEETVDSNGSENLEIEKSGLSSGSLVENSPSAQSFLIISPGLVDESNEVDVSLMSIQWNTSEISEQTLPAINDDSDSLSEDVDESLMFKN